MNEFRKFLFSMREYHRRKGNFGSVWVVGWLMRSLPDRLAVSRIGFLEFLVGRREFYRGLGNGIAVWVIDDLLTRQGVDRVSEEICSF